VAPLRVQSVIPAGSVPPVVGAEPAADPAAVEVLVGRVGVLNTMLAGAGADGLLGCFAAIDDPRDRRGIRHSLASILGLCTAAVTSGQLLLDDITAWITAADPQVLAAFGCRRDAEGRFTPPHPDTVERVFALLGAQHLADGVGAWLATRAGVGPVAAPAGGPGWLPAIAVDGKAVRGAIGEDGQVPYLLAAATHEESVVLAERLIGAKTNEVRREAPCRIPDSVRRNLEDSSWARWLTRSRKVMGTRACHEYRRSCPDARNDASGGPRDMAKAVLPEAQSPAMQVFIHRKWRLKPVPRSAPDYLVAGRNLRSGGRCPVRIFKGMSGTPTSRCYVRQGRTRDRLRGASSMATVCS
jgi:hypothetical protein